MAFSPPNMQKNTFLSLVCLIVVVGISSICSFVVPQKTAEAVTYRQGQTFVVNPFNLNYGVNPNDPNLPEYEKAGVLNQRISGNYSQYLPNKQSTNVKIVYWDRPVTFYGVPPSPTHGAAAVTPTPPGKPGIYYDDLMSAGGPVYVSGSNYGNGRPVGRAVGTTGGRAIVPQYSYR